MNLKSQLVAEEGRRNHSYQDSFGIWTIGIGHVDSTICEGVIWNDAMVDQVFARDVAEKTAEVAVALPWFDRLPGAEADDGTANARQAVLLQMAFQMGTHGMLQFKQALAGARDNRWHDAAGGMLASTWAKQTPKRAGRLAHQMATGEWQ